MMSTNAVTMHINIESTADDGTALSGFLIEDSERFWVWARDVEDARSIAAHSVFGLSLD